MSTEIRRHFVDREFVRGQVGDAQEMETEAVVWARQRTNQLHRLMSNALRSARYSAILDSEGGKFEFWNSLVLAAQAGAAIFATGVKKGEDVEVVIGQPARLRAIGPNGYTNPGVWLTSHHLAIACREKKLLGSLCSIPLRVLRESGTTADEYQYLWVEALQTYWRREEGALTKLNLALEATAPESLAIGTKDFALFVAYPSMKTFHYLAQQDTDGVKDALVEALELHKKYWGIEKRAQDPNGFIAFGLLAIACVAHDLKIPLDVASEYMPKAIVDGTWIGEGRG